MYAKAEVMKPPTTSRQAGVKACPQTITIPDYLQRVYWWTYIHPLAVRVFDRLWLINLIVLTNYHRLRDAAIAAVVPSRGSKVLQISCAYGDITPKLAAKTAGAGASLDVIDVLPIQLANVRRKIPATTPVRYHLTDARTLPFSSGSFDNVLLFLLLHETPMDVRLKVLEEACRMLRPGGRLVLTDFARPYRWNPFRYLWAVFLSIFEPFALDMWRHDIAELLPPQAQHWPLQERRFFGGLFRQVVLYRPCPVPVAP